NKGELRGVCLARRPGPISHFINQLTLAALQRQAVIRTREHSDVEVLAALQMADVLPQNHVHVVDAVVAFRQEEQEPDLAGQERSEYRTDALGNGGDRLGHWRGGAGRLPPERVEQPPVLDATRERSRPAVGAEQRTRPVAARIAAALHVAVPLRTRVESLR